ncbi:Binding-protein-dependent transport systems inner membrane component [Nostocoides japonicum T1-X7]|uniref:Binding-protein-dependent transport systems inner membrane component n=1 Tax=Nostocoides japonicum T1-X7 TaxID=1194083 RepID=A0A077LT93_9MICO|nr:carbohydrate ABC transporter permease [Tetrasphaera japonica]CCH76306.1 Binding-protein-dependent transport systems inner membrane component [Tetrasphaera japonica T1-X7]
MTVPTTTGERLRPVTADEQAAAPKSRTGLVVVLILSAVSFVFLTPFIWTTMAATKPTAQAFASPPVFAYRPTFQTFVDLWQQTSFAHYLLNTVLVAIGSVIVALLVGAPAAYALARYEGRIGAILLVLALAFRALPRFAVALPFYEAAQKLGIYDTKVALLVALVALNQPFTIWLLRNFFREIPRELDEAAMVDGCTRLQTLVRVILPVMGPGLVTAGIFTFLFAFQEYLMALVLTDVNAKTVPVFIATQIGQNLPLLQQASAATVLVALPILVLAMVVQRFLVAGLTGGSVKG